MGWFSRLFGSKGSSQSDPVNEASSASSGVSAPDSEVQRSHGASVESSLGAIDGCGPEVSQQRVEESFARLGWGEGIVFPNEGNGGGHWLMFDGASALVAYDADASGSGVINVTAILAGNRPIPKSRMLEALAWVNQQNNATRFGTCVLGTSAEGLSLRVNCPVVVLGGAWDDQLDSWLYNAVSCALQSALAAQEFFFGSEV